MLAANDLHHASLRATVNMMSSKDGHGIRYVTYVMHPAKVLM